EAPQGPAAEDEVNSRRAGVRRIGAVLTGASPDVPNGLGNRAASRHSLRQLPRPGGSYNNPGHKPGPGRRPGPEYRPPRAAHNTSAARPHRMAPNNKPAPGLK